VNRSAFDLNNAKPSYEKSFEADWKAVKKGLKKVRAEVGEPKKAPASVALARNSSIKLFLFSRFSARVPSLSS
jgi:hypothetical protein